MRLNKLLRIASLNDEMVKSYKDNLDVLINNGNKRRPVRKQKNCNHNRKVTS